MAYETIQEAADDFLQKVFRNPPAQEYADQIRLHFYAGSVAALKLVKKGQDADELLKTISKDATELALRGIRN